MTNSTIVGLWLSLAGTCALAESHAIYGEQASSQAGEPGAHKLAEPEPFKMGETVKGKCSYVHVKPSALFPGRVRVFTDVPQSEENPKEFGDVFFCGGTVEQCTAPNSGFAWARPASADPGKMAMSTFIPQANENVTVLRVPKKIGPKSPEPCFEEIHVGAFDAKTGTYVLNAASVAGHARAYGKDANAFVDAVKAGITAAEQQALQLAERQRLQPQPYVQYRQPYVPPAGDTSLAGHFLNWLNDIRVRNGHSPAVLDATMTTYACETSAKAAENNFRDRFGYFISGHPILRNTYENTTPATDYDNAMDLWIHSPSHWHTFFGNFSRVGLCAVRGPSNYLYWTFEAI